MKYINLQINRGLHLIRNYFSRCRLKNKDVTIISSNCIAGVMYHDLKLQFKSPTINLFFDADNFLRYVDNLKYYNSCELVEVDGDQSYPVGKIQDVQIHFLHYNSFDKAKECWEKRKKRINYKNLAVIMTDQEREGTSDAIERFNNISYPKIYLTNKHLNYDWSVYIPGFDGKDGLGNTIEYAKYGKRYYEYFDYIAFLNNIKNND